MRLSPIIILIFATTAYILIASISLTAQTPVIVDPATGIRIPDGETPENKKIISQMASIIVPKVDFEKLDVSAVVDFLNSKSKEFDPEHHGIKFSLQIPSHLTKTTIPLHREVSIILEKAPLNEVLGYVCQQTSLIYQIKNGTVVLKPFDPVVDWTPPANI